MWMLSLVFTWCFLVQEVHAGRGDKLIDIFKNQSPPPGLVRRVRDPYKGLKCNFKFCRPPPTTTTPKPAPPTKSLEEIIAEKQKELMRVNPKAISKKFGGGGVPRSIDDSIYILRKNIRDQLTSCVANADCGNRTCCQINKDGIGNCVLRPHKVGDDCSNMCACVNNLVCKTMELDQEEGVVTKVNKCGKQVVKKELAPDGMPVEVFQRWKMGVGKGGKGGKGGDIKFSAGRKEKSLLKRSNEERNEGR